jgi:hypothetical protein
VRYHPPQLGIVGGRAPARRRLPRIAARASGDGCRLRWIPAAWWPRLSVMRDWGPLNLRDG